MDNLQVKYADALKALEGLLRNPHISLGDKVYDVRSSEGQGWDGPAVKAWSDAVDLGEKVLKAEGL